MPIFHKLLFQKRKTIYWALYKRRIENLATTNETKISENKLKQDQTKIMITDFSDIIYSAQFFFTDSLLNWSEIKQNNTRTPFVKWYRLIWNCLLITCFLQIILKRWTKQSKFLAHFRINVWTVWQRIVWYIDIFVKN